MPRRRRRGDGREVESSSSVAAARGDASTFAAAGCRGARGRLRRRRGLLLLGLRWHGGGWGGAASGEVTRFGALVGFKFFLKKNNVFFLDVAVGPSMKMGLKMGSLGSFGVLGWRLIWNYGPLGL